MNIATIGAGFTGLTAALRLAQKGYRVTLFEKERVAGGLAVGFREENWQWSLERAYHHWFTNDTHALTLAKELGVSVLVKRPRTDVYLKGQQLPFDSPLSLLSFPHLSVIDRLRTGAAVLFLKSVNNYHRFDGLRATPWIKKWMGEKSFAIIWEPLFTGKFGGYKDDIALSWFWARIKKRTPSLAYPAGGFGVFTDRLVNKIKRLGGAIYFNTLVQKIANTGKEITVATAGDQYSFDKVIVTLPTPVFVKLAKAQLPPDYIKRISSTNYLHALNLVLILKKPLMKGTYWLNITDTSFPFLVLVEHTNFMESKYYAGNHIVYIGNYLPADHRYFKMTGEELLKEFTPFLKKINWKLEIGNWKLFYGPFAQPVVTTDYEKKMPMFKTPIDNVFLANLSMVYPWDRGTNYAIEMGEKVAKILST